MRSRSPRAGRLRGPPPAHGAARRSGRARAIARGRPHSRRSRRDARGCAVRKLVFPDEIAPGEICRIEPSRRPAIAIARSSAKYTCGPPKPRFEAGRTAVRQHDAIPGCDVPHSVRTAQGPVHPVQGRRLRRSDVRADILDRVVAKRQQLASAEKPASSSVTRAVDAELAVRCSRRSSVHRTGTPSGARRGRSGQRRRRRQT